MVVKAQILPLHQAGCPRKPYLGFSRVLKRIDQMAIDMSGCIIQARPGSKICLNDKRKRPGRSYSQQLQDLLKIVQRHAHAHARIFAQQASLT